MQSCQALLEPACTACRSPESAMLVRQCVGLIEACVFQAAASLTDVARRDPATRGPQRLFVTLADLQKRFSAELQVACMGSNC